MHIITLPGSLKFWLNVRSGKDDINKYVHGQRFQGLNMLAYTLSLTFMLLWEMKYHTYLCQVIR